MWGGGGGGGSHLKGAGRGPMHGHYQNWLGGAITKIFMLYVIVRLYLVGILLVVSKCLQSAY